MKKSLLLAAFMLSASPCLAASVFNVDDTSGTVNGVVVTGAATGNAPSISSAGSDTNVGLVLNTQGAGVVSIGTTAAGSELNINGGVSIGTSYVGTAAPVNGAIVQGIVGIGTAAPGAGLDVQTAPTVSGGVAYGSRLQQTLTASANNDSLTALYINPTFTNGAYTGVADNGLIVASGNVGIGTSSPDALLDIGDQGTTLGTLRLESSTASSYVQLQPSTASGAWTMTLPSSGGTSGALLQTNGSGVTSWIAPGALAGLTLGTSASVTNPQRSGDATTGFYSDTPDVVEVAAGGVEVEQWNTATGANTYVSVTPGDSAPPTIGVGGTSSGLDVSGGSGALTLETTASNGAIDLTPDGTGPVILTSGVTTGTGSTAGFEQIYNALTTGNGEDVSSTSLTGGNLASLSSNGTAAAANQTLLNLALSGTNGTSGVTTYGEKISNTHGGSGTNIGLYATASGGTNNYAAIFPSGSVGIGTGSPAYTLDVRGTAGSTLASNQMPVINKINVQTFTSSGTYTPSTGMVYARIEVWGAGGGGGGAAAATSQSAGGGGGGGGAYARGVKTASTIGASQTVTVGAAGAGGTAGNNAGGSGGSSSVGSLISAGGGGGGEGAAASASTGPSAGSNGGGSPGGTYDYGVPGQDGFVGFTFGSTNCLSGSGGNSGSGSPGAYQVGGNNTGATVAGYGGGGSGGCIYNTTTTKAGGAGSPGLVVITEYISD